MNTQELEYKLRDYGISNKTPLSGSTVGINNHGICGELVLTEAEYRLLTQTHDYSSVFPTLAMTLHINFNGTFCRINRLTDEA